MLSWVERKVAAAMFAEPPTASMEEALACFLKVDLILYALVECLYFVCTLGLS